jgi:hypothetical protein
MDAFNVLQSNTAGDTCELTDKQIRQLEMDGAFDSYDQVYEIEGRRWKIRTKIARPDSSTLFTLQCVEE